MTVRVHGLEKAFGGSVALAGVDLSVEPGEIHALLGPNGAGKSTLIGCLCGALTPDAGRIDIDGEVYSELTSGQALRAGVAVIYQHLSLAGPLSVADNVFLGMELRRGPLIRHRAQRLETRRLLDGLAVDVRIDPSEPVERLPLASQQLVEIARALHRGPVRLLILDEPTAALTEVEAQMLADHLRRLKRQGIHIIYTTHLLNEVFAVADRVTVLRDGRVVMSGLPVSEIDSHSLVQAITGGAVSERQGWNRVIGEPVIEIDRLSGKGFGPVSLTVGAGEIVALHGPLGSGASELVETIFGVRRPRAGAVRVIGRARRFRRPADALSAGVALVPADRLKQGIFPPLSTLDNMALPSVSALSVAGTRRRGRESRLFADAAGRVRLSPRTPGLRVAGLSGGNQQKVMLGRWLEYVREIRLLLLDEPTHGIDVGARADIYELMRETVARGDRAILMASSDPDEVAEVADRAIAMRRGHIVGELGGADITDESLLELVHAGEERDGAVAL